MIKFIKENLMGIIALLILIPCGMYLLYEFYCIFIASSDDKKMDFGMLAITVAVALFTLKANKEREIKARQFNEKKHAYEEFMTTLLEIMQEVKNNSKKSDEIFEKKMWDLKKQILVYSSQDFINEFATVMNSSQNNIEGNEKDPIDMLASLERMISYMRLDLGHISDDPNFKFYTKLFVIPDTIKEQNKDN